MKPDVSAYAGKRVLVTGAAGFVGRHLVRALADAGSQLCLLAREPLEEFRSHHVVTGDLRERETLAALVDNWRPEIVFHLAASRARTLAPEAFSETIAVNLVGTLQLLDALSRNPALQRAVLLGTAEEYGRGQIPFREDERESPVSAYSLSKLAATHLAQMLAHTTGMPVAVLRPSVAYGPGQHEDMFLPALIRSLLRAQRFPMTSGEQTRDFIFIDDLVRALLASGHACDINGEVINIGSGVETRIADLVDRVEILIGTHGLADKGAIPYRTGEAMRYLLDIGKAQALLQWQPEIRLDEGLRRTVTWYADQ